MNDFRARTFSNYDCNLSDYAHGASIEITKGSLKGCKGKISGATCEGLYFIARDRCDRDNEGIYSPIELFASDEFELSD